MTPYEGWERSYGWESIWGSPGSQPDCDDEAECFVIENTVDVTTAMADAGCSSRDIEEVIDKLIELFDGELLAFKHICENGAVIEVRDEGDRVEVHVTPPGEEGGEDEYIGGDWG